MTNGLIKCKMGKVSTKDKSRKGRKKCVAKKKPAKKTGNRCIGKKKRK